MMLVDLARLGFSAGASPFTLTRWYTSRVRIERQHGPMRLAYLPAEKTPVVFGVHSEVAEHYKVESNAFPPHATTLDYVVAEAAG